MPCESASRRVSESDSESLSESVSQSDRDSRTDSLTDNDRTTKLFSNFVNNTLFIEHWIFIKNFASYCFCHHFILMQHA